MSTEPKDVREMRQRITRAQRGMDRVDGKEVSRSGIAPASSLIRNVLMMGEHNGWSGEDIMTALAYHALVQYEQVYDRLLESAMLSPASSFLFPKESP